MGRMSHRNQERTERRISAAASLMLCALTVLAQIAVTLLLTRVLKEKASFVYGFLQLIGAAVAIRVYQRSGSPSYKLSWMCLLLILPVAGMLLFCLWGGTHQAKQLSLKPVPPIPQRESAKMLSDLHFFDAAAPLVSAESVDMEHAWMGSRYDKGTDDYVNCPMNQEEYDAFWQELTTAQEAEVHGFEDGQVFEGCMPVEVMARRGEDTLRFGPLKPRGLPDPKTGKEPYAVVQLRRDNADGSIYNLVGFQTHLRWPEQKRVFTMIPALKDAQFLRYGVMHRNTYLDSPRLLDRYYRLKSRSRIAFAGQMTGVEGYVESCASGFLVGVETARRLKGQAPIDFPQETAIGALGLYVSNQTVGVFQPMNINFGIIPLLDHRVKGKRNKNAELSQRSLAIIEARKEEILS